jgi:D-serine deaminase-like pyridoxal phosphate-dependent protein
MRISEIDTPALIINQKTMQDNIRTMQKHAQAWGVNLRPHTKTHKMPYVAQLQLEEGAVGITVAKTGEAQIMADNGIRDIFIANEIIGSRKLNRIRTLVENGIRISFGVDSIPGLQQITTVFSKEYPARVLIEIETGENRSGVIDEETFHALLNYIQASPCIILEGVFSHEGHSYKAKDQAECLQLFETAQRQTLHYASIARSHGFPCPVVSIGSTPSILIAAMHGVQLLNGITEIRPGTYVFMDVGQGNAIQSYEHCAASVLTTIISKPTKERVIADAGAKALTMQSRTEGICATVGKGQVRNLLNTRVQSVYDEHTIFNDLEFHDSVEIGDTIEIIPNHICPVVNLYDEAHFVEDGVLIRTIPILGRGKTQ